MRRSDLRKFIGIFSMLFVAPAILLIGISAWLYLNEVETADKVTHQSEKLQLVQSREMLENHLHNAIRDLMLLADIDQLRRPLTSPGQNRNNETLTRYFKSMVERKGQYDQIRFLDLSGKEVVRVNYRNGEGVNVAEHKLQHKGGRYYFTETMAKGPGEIFVSPMDLNVEHGVIESPYKPMLRLATPIYDDFGNKHGMVIINYLADKLIVSLKAQTDISRAKLLLLNRDGYWLKGESSADEWGFMFPEKQALTMANRYPDAWKAISGSESGQISSENGLFTYTTVTLEQLLAGPGLKHEPIGSPVDGQSTLWKLVRFIPQSGLDQPADALAKRYLAVNGILLVVWGVVALLLSRARQFRIEAGRQLHDKEKRISEIVNSAFDAIITINERGIIETFNPAACRLFDYREDDVLGQKVNMLMASPSREYHDLHIQNYIESGVGKFIDKPGRVTGIRSDGSAVEIEICIGAKRVNDHWLFTAICRRYQEAGESDRRLAV
ncbi:MAG: PAS domain S-box protein [Candidatus Thiodiazotropha sp. (ex Ctena orbiculata)]|uniref:PAS domain S-box protein n=1 Tax=Candidatus Thiodiazotropha taylori TaxID=2792791 RepID=A0A944M889_9GAMM|nr:PAS domain S-box protein [Candidatus Thiodiazotropha taylori]MBT2989786.1 PAS domain S-box protein [Candidatus Thiodiazotropha taylori]MBT2995500.1 PAS domain S-box protein [Candidatus Thiodiazotropha taylori]MBT2999546.1 PAS domain S-box protein [Candidatus Thiodiazotropha taylori]MBT3025780.1 PAS domain S-box protein [Candidatus Thiodiazotropha taylori]